LGDEGGEKIVIQSYGKISFIVIDKTDFFMATLENNNIPGRQSPEVACAGSRSLISVNDKQGFTI
jgi:hypothetical protein